LPEKKIKFTNIDMLSLLGLNDVNIKVIEERFDISIVVRGDTVTVQGSAQQTEQVEKVFKELGYILSKNGELHVNDVETVIDLILVNGDAAIPKNIASTLRSDEIDSVVLYTRNGIIKAKTPKQRDYLRKAKENDIVFAIGPAGTGKTYLAVAIAVAALKNHEITKIILARPAVEAGESLGFLPGDLQEKVNPYLRPLYDALNDMIPLDKLKAYLEKQVIEIAPLAYMRGRTLNNAYVILDEAQNATSMQMKMCLTRLGVNSRAIITGDITQIDLPQRTISGLVQIQDILKDIPGISYVYFDKSDVVRHRLVKEILNAYEKHYNDKAEQEKNSSPTS